MVVSRPTLPSARARSQAVSEDSRIPSVFDVVVYGYGALVVNNIPETVSPDIQSANKFVQVSAYPTSFGAERFQWNPSTHTW